MRPRRQGRRRHGVRRWVGQQQGRGQQARGAHSRLGSSRSEDGEGQVRYRRSSTHVGSHLRTSQTRQRQAMVAWVEQRHSCDDVFSKGKFQFQMTPKQKNLSLNWIESNSNYTGISFGIQLNESLSILWSQTGVRDLSESGTIT